MHENEGILMVNADGEPMIDVEFPPERVAAPPKKKGMPRSKLSNMTSWFLGNYAKVAPTWAEEFEVWFTKTFGDSPSMVRRQANRDYDVARMAAILAWDHFASLLDDDEEDTDGTEGIGQGSDAVDGGGSGGAGEGGEAGPPAP